MLISKEVLEQNSYNHIRNAHEFKSKHTVYTDIDIYASIELVRNKFQEFSNWSKSCKVIPEIKVISADDDNLETNPKLV